MSFWRKKVESQGIRVDTVTPIKETIKENLMQPLADLRPQANEERRLRRASAANSIVDLDQLAAEMRASNATWQVIADLLGYANGAVARRAALRHSARLISKESSVN